ncbi:hypothetical protein ABWK34_11345, partial [Bacillus safensis]|uniref:hypothetical protein n=1 Tax=Bacillus safensis TaxID=561879 RepID=UPI00339AAEDF
HMHWTAGLWITVTCNMYGLFDLTELESEDKAICIYENPDYFKFYFGIEKRFCIPQSDISNAILFSLKKLI